MRFFVIAACAMALSGHASPLRAQGVKKLEKVWEFATPREFPQGMVVDALRRPYLHVAMKNGGLIILDISNEKKPQVAARISTSQLMDLDVMHLAQRGEYLYLALGDHFSARGSATGLAVVSVKSPNRPHVTGIWKSPDMLRGSAIVVVDGPHAYLGAMAAGVMTFDVSAPAKIRHLSTFQPDPHFPRKNPNAVQHPNARGMVVRGNMLFVANDAGGLRILDVSDRKKPKEIGRYVNAAMANKQQAFNNLALDKNLVFLACDYAGLEILDVSNPREIRQIGWWNPWEAHLPKNLWFNSGGHTNQIEFDAKRKEVYLSSGGSELQVVDVSQPSKPRLSATYRDARGRVGVWGLAMSRDRVYLGYITAAIPFPGTWAGIIAVER